MIGEHETLEDVTEAVIAVEPAVVYDALNALFYALGHDPAVVRSVVADFSGERRTVLSLSQLRRLIPLLSREARAWDEVTRTARALADSESYGALRPVIARLRDLERCFEVSSSPEGKAMSELLLSLIGEFEDAVDALDDRRNSTDDDDDIDL